ncbi:hypothetical protein SB778_03795 [Paraburkholderia sp. SIMBA_050]
MSITFEEIIATVDTSEFKLAGAMLGTESAETLDNLYLDAYGQVIDQFHNREITAASVGMVYDAAKVIFARGQAKRTFDLATAASMGSPWEHQCDTPEEWAACFARRHVETGEGCVEDEAVDQSVVERASWVCGFLVVAGVKPETVISLLPMVCHDNAKLIAMCRGESA